MRFSTLLTLPLLCAAVTKAVYIPSLPLANSVQDAARGLPQYHGTAHLGPRTCTGCSGGDGLDLGTNIDLSVFTHVQLQYIRTCIGALATLNANAIVKANSIKTAIHLSSYSTTELDRLTVALGVFIKAKGSLLGLISLDNSTRGILSLAQLNIITLTKIEVDCLQAIISAVLKVKVDLTAIVRADLLGWCTPLAVLTNVQLGNICTVLDSTIYASATIIGTASHNTTTTVGGAVDLAVNATIKIKTDLKVHVEGLIAKANILVVLQLKLVLNVIQAWIKTDVGLLAVLGVKANTDAAVCSSILALLKVAGYANVATDLKLNLSALSSISV